MMTILAPTDFSRSANSAVEYAIQFSSLCKCKVAFFHCTFKLFPASISPEEKQNGIAVEIERETKRLKKLIEKRYAKLRKKFDPKKNEFFVTYDASPLNQILSIIEEKKFDMVIMGTHGASGVKKVLFGSNTSQVIEQAKVPVLAVPARRHFTKAEELVYATDLVQPKKELSVLKQYSRLFKAKINSVHFDYGWARDKKENSNIKFLEHSGTRYHSKHISIEASVPEALRKYMRKHPHGILCMFHGHKNLLQRLISGSETEDLSFKLNSPLLSIHKN